VAKEIALMWTVGLWQADTKLKEVNTMGFLTVSDFHSFDDLLAQQVKDLYDAEHRLVDALPKMAGAATSAILKDAFLEHLEQTKVHVRRLEQVFTSIGVPVERETCQAMKGLISEGHDVVEAKGVAAVRDAALIAAAQRVEHYEIAAYGSARTFARQLGLTEAADLLQATLDEEGAADKKLTEIATHGINAEAARSSVAHAP
jgi:ferritin-like metal-binding protein YciE